MPTTLIEAIAAVMAQPVHRARDRLRIERCRSCRTAVGRDFVGSDKGIADEAVADHAVEGHRAAGAEQRVEGKPLFEFVEDGSRDGRECPPSWPLRAAARPVLPVPLCGPPSGRSTATLSARRQESACRSAAPGRAALSRGRHSAGLRARGDAVLGEALPARPSSSRTGRAADQQPGFLIGLADRRKRDGAGARRR